MPPRGASPYSVSAGYDPASRLVPLASNPPPIPVATRRVIPQPKKGVFQPKGKKAAPAASPYGVRDDYDPSMRLIPASSAPPLRADPIPVRRPQPALRRGPPPMQPVVPPPMHMMYGGPPQKRGWEPQQPAFEPMPEEQEPPPPPLRIAVAPTASFVADGFDENGAAVYFDSRLSVALTPSTSYILAELVEDVAEEVQIHHDSEWDQFPEIGQAVLDAGGEQSAMCVAFCPSLAAWGVGLGGKWQKRENIAKLALCVSLVEKSPNGAAVLQQHPEFADFCDSSAGGRRKKRKVAPKAKSSLKPVMKASAPAPAIMPAAAPEEEPPLPPLRISVSPSATFIGDGSMDTEGAAIYFDSRLSVVTCSTSYIISELVDDVASEVTIHHDADWDQFPEVGEALVQAGGEQNAMCLAVCHSLGAWGVGVGGKWQKRENIAKLALCVSLVEKSEKAQDVFQAHPEFAEFCGVEQPKKKPKAKAKQSLKPLTAAAAPAMLSAPAAASSAGFPKDTPIWINLPDGEPMPDQLDGMLPQALAVSTDGTKRKALYANVEKVLGDIVGDPEAEIEYHDDFDWKNFPTVGAALKEVSDKEECLCVAICKSQSVWAVGTGMKGGPRWKAAKVAIAATILSQSMDAGEDFSEMENTSFLEFVEEARQARDALE